MANKQKTEATLADLATSVIFERTPSLADHLLGFELLEDSTNEENTRAAGILGFQVGQEVLYVPALFLNGKLKGTEVLYLSRSDVFVSNTKQWIEYLTNRNPGIMGAGEHANPQQVPGASLQVFHRLPGNGKMATLDKIAGILDIKGNVQKVIEGMPGNTPATPAAPAAPATPTTPATAGVPITSESPIQSAVPKKAFLKGAAQELFDKVANDFSVLDLPHREEYSLPNVLKSLGKQAYLNFMTDITENPELFAKVAQMYDLESLKLEFPDEPEAKHAAEVIPDIQLMIITAEDLQEYSKIASGELKTDEATATSLVKEPKEVCSCEGECHCGAAANKKEIKPAVIEEVHGKAASDASAAEIKEQKRPTRMEFAKQEARRGAILGALLATSQGALHPGGFGGDSRLANLGVALGAAGFGGILGGGIGAALSPVSYQLLHAAKQAAIESMTVEEREQCFRHGFFVMDKRAAEEKTPVYREDYRSRFSSPTETGFYEIVNKHGEIEKVLVAVSPFVIEAPKKSMPGSLIVDLDSGIFCAPAHGDQIFVRSRLTIDEAKWKEAVTSGPKVSSVKPGKTYMLIGEDFRCSAPFHVNNKIGTGGDISLTVETPFEVACRCNSDSIGDPCCSSWGRGGETIRIVDREDSSTIHKIGDITFVPSTWRVIEVDEDSLSYRYRIDDSTKAKRKTLDSITPGNSATLTAAILEKNLFKMNLHKSGSWLVAGIHGHNTDPMDKTAAVEHFVCNMGMSVEDALGCWDDTMRSHDCVRHLDMSKVAASMADQIYGGTPFPTDQGDMGVNNLGVQERQPFSQREPVTMNSMQDPSHDWRNMDEANWDRIKPQDTSFLLRAANSGNQPVFDSAMIGTLLRTNRASAKVDQWLPDLVNSLDVHCRLLLLFYWHNQDFAEDYGKDELAEFEDVLLDAIKTEGKLVLFLKQKAGESSSVNVDAMATH